MAELSRRDLILGGGLLLAGSRLFAANPLSSDRAQPAIAPARDHEWIRTARILLAEAYNPPFYPELDYDPEKAVHLAKALNANAFRFPAAAYYAYFPTRTNYPVHPKLAGDPMRETLRLCHAANLKAIAYIPVNHPFMDVNAANPRYPSWQRRDANGKPFVTTHFGFSRYYEGCLNSSLSEEIFALLQEVLTYDFDLVYFDGPYQGMDHRAEFCHCESCRAAFMKATGREIPSQDAPVGDLIAYTRWMNDDVARGMLQRLTDEVHATRALPVLYNNTSMLSRGWCRSRLISVTDGFMFEAAETPEQKLFNLQLGKSTDKVIWTYVGYHSQYNREHLKDKSIRGWYSYPVDGDDLLMDGSVAFSAGTGVVFWSLSRLYFMPHPPESYAEGKNIRTTFDLVEKYSDLLRTTCSSPQAGLLVNTQTIEWCSAPSFILSAYANGFHGIWQVMQEGSIASEPFLDFDSDRLDLNRYHLIYLSNAACLSSAQCLLLADFVTRGGTLVATSLSGLYDEYGRPQKHRPLHDLLGIAFTSDEPEERPELYLKIPGRNELIPQDPQIIHFQPAGDSTVLATTYDLARHENLGPAITRRNYGSGRVIYIGSNLEATYDETRMPVLRGLLLELLEPSLGASRRYRIPAGKGLLVQYSESPQAVLLHLIANTGNKIKKLRADECYLPVTNIPVAIRIPGEKSPMSARLLRADKPIQFAQKNGWVNLNLDSIYIHETVMLSLA